MRANKLSIEALGWQLDLVGGTSEVLWPKNAGLIFFSPVPEKFFPGTQIDVVWFPEGAGGDRFEEIIFKGPLDTMIREALGYIRRNYLYETVLKHPDRAEATRFWNFPYAAIEETVVNAVYHRSYEDREPIEVRISHNELVVLSFPGPDHSIKLADLESGRAVSRRYRNRCIGEFLKELELTEGRSTGIPKILKAMTANGSPAPLFETDTDRAAFVVRLPVHPLATKRVAENGDIENSSRNSSGKSSVKILILLENNPNMAIPELAEQLNISPRAIEKILNFLKSKNKIKRVGSAKGGHWQVANPKGAWADSAIKSSGKILMLLGNNPNMTIPELVEQLDILSRAVEKMLNVLKKANAIKRIGSAKGGYWQVLD